MKVRLGERCLSPSQNGGIYLQIFKRKFMFRSVYSVHFDKSLVLADDSVYSGERRLHKNFYQFCTNPMAGSGGKCGRGLKTFQYPTSLLASIHFGHYSCITLHYIEII